MQISNVKISELKPYEKNPRKNDSAVNDVANSIKEFGFKVPIVIDTDNVIVAGHTRYKAAKQLNLDVVPCIIADDLTEEQIKAFRLADNKVAEKSEWDFNLLNVELDEILNIDMSDFGFDLSNIDSINLEDKYKECEGKLREQFLIPPFSVLDTKQGYWQKRKALWKSIIKSDAGRSESLLSNGLLELNKSNGKSLTGTSIFDPILCEILINWFCPKGGKILDPFAGGSVRGLVSFF